MSVIIPPLQEDRPVLGLLLMLVFCAVAPMADTTAKLLGALMPVALLLLLRFAMPAVFLLPVVWAARRPLRMGRRALVLVFWRTLLHIGGLGSMFTSLLYLPLANTVAISFVMPFLILIAGRFFLDEEVGPRRMIACAVGFLGTLMVIQPSFAEVGALALLPLAVAVFFAGFMLVTRQVAKQVDPVGMQVVSGAMAVAVLLPVLIIAQLVLPGVAIFVPIPPEAWVLLIALGCFGSFGHLLMTWSLRFAPSATLAPMQYLEIPFATLAGWLVFHDFPNQLALAGIVVTIGAGLYVILREQAIARRNPAAATPLPPAPPPA